MLKCAPTGRIVSVAVIVAVAVNSDGRREVLGIEIGASEERPSGPTFLRCAGEARLARREAGNLGCP